MARAFGIMEKWLHKTDGKGWMALHSVGKDGMEVIYSMRALSEG